MLQQIPRRTEAKREVPIACTLDAAAVSDRLMEWELLAAQVVERTDVPEGMQLRFVPEVSAAEVAELAAKEHGCCSFLAFSVGIADGETTLTIAAPPEARGMIDALLHPS
jgi:hypothetical protein